MKIYKHLLFSLFFFSLGCQEPGEKLSESAGDMTFSGQRMLDVVVAPDKINGTLFITSPPSDQITDLSGTSPHENLSGVSQVKIVTGDLWIKDNMELTDLSHLEALTTIGKSIMIKNNPKVAHLDFIKDLESFNGIELKKIGISNLDFLKNTKQLSGFLGLHELSNLKTFTLLDIEQVKGLFLDSLDHMTNTDFLQNLATITDAIYIQKNPNLQRVTLKITNSTLNSHLNISSNALLAEIKGLDQLETINRQLKIIDNASITNLDFLKGIEHINGGLWIRGNTNLADFSGLAGIKSVKGPIQIEDNGPIDAEIYGQILSWKKQWKSGSQ